MRYNLFITAIAISLLTACSSAYKTGQTPDDVYYSPARSEGGVVAGKNNDGYDEYVSSTDERYLRMKVQNRSRWGAIDDFNYWNDPYGTFNYGIGYGYTSYFGNYYYSPFYSPFAYNSLYWSGYYSPFYSDYYGWGYYPYPVVVKNPIKIANTNRPTLGSYNNSNYNNVNNAGRSSGTFRKVFSPNPYNNSNNSPSRSSDAPVRTYTPSSSGSSSSGSSGGGVSRPARRG